jgi:hypothetical protein
MPDNIKEDEKFEAKLSSLRLTVRRCTDVVVVVRMAIICGVSVTEMLVPKNWKLFQHSLEQLSLCETINSVTGTVVIWHVVQAVLVTARNRGAKQARLIHGLVEKNSLSFFFRGQKNHNRAWTLLQHVLQSKTTNSARSYAFTEAAILLTQCPRFEILPFALQMLSDAQCWEYLVGLLIRHSDFLDDNHQTQLEEQFLIHGSLVELIEALSAEPHRPDKKKTRVEIFNTVANSSDSLLLSSVYDLLLDKLDRFPELLESDAILLGLDVFFNLALLAVSGDSAELWFCSSDLKFLQKRTGHGKVGINRLFEISDLNGFLVSRLVSTTTDFGILGLNGLAVYFELALSYARSNIDAPLNICLEEKN